jgi:hypothetical protein
MSWLLFHVRSKSPRNPGPFHTRQCHRLELEHLEERTVLDIPLLIPAGALVDNMATSAAMLPAAPAIPEPAASDIVQISVGVSPEDTANADMLRPAKMNRPSSKATFAHSLYEDFLETAHDTANPLEAGSWINAISLATLAQATLVNDLLHSRESERGAKCQSPSDE